MVCSGTSCISCGAKGQLCCDGATPCAHGGSCVSGACECPGGNIESACADGDDSDCDGTSDCDDGDCYLACDCPGHDHAGGCGSVDNCGHTIGSADDCDCPGAQSCDCDLPWGGTLANGDQVEAYDVATTGCEVTCPQPELRVCEDGILSGTATSESCTVGACASCTAPWDGPPIPHGDSIQAYPSASVTCGNTCVAQTRICNNGVLSGDATEQGCSVGACSSCTSPFGGTIPHGQSIQAYPSAAVGCETTCSAQTRVCDNGTLSGSATNQSCSVMPCCCGTSSSYCNFVVRATPCGAPEMIMYGVTYEGPMAESLYRGGQCGEVNYGWCCLNGHDGTSC
jgi:hypothetical protein